MKKEDSLSCHFQRIWQSGLSIIFPNLCLHCEEQLQPGRLVCNGCAGFFELIDINTRCIHCFSECSVKKACSNCVKKKRWHGEIAAACDAVGAAKTLAVMLKDGKAPYVAKTAASLMAVQFSHLQWPLPDYVVPMPKRLWLKGANHSELLARHLASIFQLPMKKLLKTQTPTWRNLASDEEFQFYCKDEQWINGKTILVIDDVIDSGWTFQKSAQVLKDAGSAKVYGLAYLKTLSETK